MSAGYQPAGRAASSRPSVCDVSANGGRDAAVPAGWKPALLPVFAQTLCRQCVNDAFVAKCPLAGIQAALLGLAPAACEKGGPTWPVAGDGLSRLRHHSR